MSVSELLVNAIDAGQRLDAWLPRQTEGLTRSHGQKLIEEGLVLVDGKHAKSNHRLKPGQIVQVTIPQPKEYFALPENLPIEIIYQDADLAVVNKPAGMVTHPAQGNHSGTLVNALLYHIGDLSGINGVMRPGIVHRLDKETSGLLLIAKTDRAHLSLSEQIKAREVKREYLAIVHGRLPKDRGTINAPIARHQVERKQMAVVEGGRKAITHYHVKERYGNYTFVQLRLETGRTHQIRVHMSYIGHPVVGDKVYGPRRSHFDLSGQLLHAYRLTFSHPITQEMMQFSVQPPEHFLRVLTRLQSS